MDYGVSVQNIMRYLRAQTNEVNILYLMLVEITLLKKLEHNTFTERKWTCKDTSSNRTLIAFSTDSGQTAPDGDGDNSTYTVSLFKNMLLEDTSIDQVFRNVRAEVLSETDGMQRPVESTQLTGQTFYLRAGNFENEFIEIDNYFIENNIELSLELATKIIIKDPDNAKAYTKKAHAYSLLEKYDEAEKFYKQSIDLNPNFNESYLAYYMHPDGGISYVGLLNLYHSGYIQSSEKMLSNIFRDYKALTPNNPYYYRLYTQFY